MNFTFSKLSSAIKQKRHKRDNQKLLRLRSETVSNFTFSKHSTAIEFDYQGKLICIGFNSRTGIETVSVDEQIVHNEKNEKSQHTTIDLKLDGEQYELTFGYLSVEDLFTQRVSVILRKQGKAVYHYKLSEWQGLKQTSGQYILFWLLTVLLSASLLFIFGYTIGSALGKLV